MIKENISHYQQIDEHSLMLIDSLDFLVDAFHNRKDALSTFRDELELSLINALQNETDYKVAVSIINCMVLFRQSSIQAVAARIFRINNTQLNNMILENCRLFSAELSKEIEYSLCESLSKMSSSDYRKRFFDWRFSFSVWSSLQYVKDYHLSFVIGKLFLVAGIFIMIIPTFIVSQFEQFPVSPQSFSLGSVSLAIFDLTLVFLGAGFVKIMRRIPEYILFEIHSGNHYSLLRHSWNLFWHMSKRVMSFFVVLPILMLVIVPFTSLINLSLDALFSDMPLMSIVRKVALILISLFASIKFFPKLFRLLSVTFKKIIDYIRSFVAYIHATNDLEGVDYLCRTDFLDKMNSMPTMKYRRKYVQRISELSIYLNGSWPENERPKYEDETVDNNLSEIEYVSLKHHR